MAKAVLSPHRNRFANWLPKARLPQYVDLSGKATYDSEYNPNQSVLAVEGITSPDGRVLGKMAHTERFSAEDVFRTSLATNSS